MAISGLLGDLHPYQYYIDQSIMLPSGLIFLAFVSSCQVEVDWDKIQSKIEMELSREREKAANASVRSSVAARR